MSSPTSSPSVREIVAAAQLGDPTVAVREAAGRIDLIDGGAGRINAFLSTLDNPSLDEEAARPGIVTPTGPGGKLLGVPVAIKDNLVTIDLPTTCGSKILDGYQSPFEATAVRRLRAAGAVIVGKTNLDEFAMGSSTEHSAFGPTMNPWDHTRVPGGSSGGSAAAVSAGLVPVALGSETGGSVRQPASFCGVVGVKPTYGRVSRYGLVAFASSLDHVGVFGGRVDDAARALEVVSGHDPFDSTSSDHAVPSFTRAVEAGVDGLVLGVPREYFPSDLDAEVANACRDALRRLEGAGATLREISLPHTRYAVATYYVICTAEASSNLARYDGVRYGLRVPEARATAEVYVESRSRGFGTEVKRRILLGTYVLSAGYYEAYYGRAQKVRTLLKNDFRAVFDDGVDAIFTPTTATQAFEFGARLGDPVQMYQSDAFTVTANLTGIPAISVPIGDRSELPIGGQVMAPWWQEETMFRVAGALEMTRQ